MSDNKKISAVQIFLSLAVMICCAVLSAALNAFSIEQAMIQAVAISTAGFILCMINSRLYVTHWRRYKQNKGDSILFTVIGIIIFTVVLLLNHFFIHANIGLTDTTTVPQPAILPLLLLVNCVIAPINFMVIFKLLTDRLPIRKNETAIIFISSVICGLFFTALAYTPGASISYYLQQFIFVFLIALGTSYLYNQSRSLVCSMLSLSIVLIAASLLVLL